MKYLKIILVGYRRMRLNQIDHFEMNLSAPLQLILGTNGSGKSSLLWELSPLPPNPQDFMPGGSKMVEIEHNGHHYVLSFTLIDKAKFSFVVDGKELNESKLITVQKELVKEHFKVTQDIQEMVCGQDTFDTMSTAKRKDWFLRLCDVNYDYALQVFGRLKNAHRDRTGAVRLERRALVVESEKLLSEQEVVRLMGESKQLHESLNLLLEYRKPVEGDRTVMELEGMQLDRQLVNMANAFQELHQRINDREHTDSELVEFIEWANAKALQAQSRVSLLAEQHEQVTKKLDVLHAAGENTIAGLEQRLIELQSALAVKTASSLLGRAVNNPTQALAAFDSVYLSLVEIFNEIPINTDRIYSQGALLQKRQELDDLMRVKNNVLEKIAEKKASLSHMRDHIGKPDVTCPQCSHAFSLIYSEERMNSLIQASRDLDDRLQTDIYPKILELEAYIAECTRYASYYRQYVQLTANNAGLLKPYWDLLQDKQIITSSPREGVNELMRIGIDLRAQVDLEQLLTQQREVNTTLEMLKSVGEADAVQLKAQAIELEEQLNKDTHELQVAQEQHRHYKAQFDLRRQAGTIRRNIRKTIKTHRELMQGLMEHDRRSILNQLIRDLQSALAQREHALHAAQRQKDVVDGMARRIEMLVKEEEALAILVKELSPTEGLIAEGMLGFIKNFCDQMNELIAQVWSYPLEVLSCEVVEGESIDLDYRFPLIQGEERRKVSDVVKGSEGMRDIVNLAFRMTAMQYLGLQQTPLYLDEMGASFDVAHRSAAANMIRALIEQSTFPQVFMISHYQGVYGALANAQICVLDPTNILVPKTYNEHVVMK